MSSSSVYQACSNAHEGDSSLVMECVVDWIENDLQASIQQSVQQNELTDWLLILCGALIFFMQAGFAMLCAGAVRKKNVNNTLLKNLLDACGAAIGFYAIGYGLANNSSPLNKRSFAGASNFFLMDGVNPALFFFQYAFSATTVTIVAGTLAERCKMVAYLCYSLVLIAFVYPIVAHFIWSSSGYLSSSSSDPLFGSGMIDFAGSGVVHTTGGAVALYASLVLGPRNGRFHDKDGNILSKPGLTKGHSIALQMLGTLILWFGWYGFNGGSALLLTAENRAAVAARAAITTTLSAAAGAMSSLFTNAFIKDTLEGEFSLDIVVAMNGCLSGLVAVTGSCGVIHDFAALLIGIFAGWVYLLSNYLLIRFKIDDAVDAIPVHLVNGLWGSLAVGLFAAPKHLRNAGFDEFHPGFFYDATDGSLLAAQLVGSLFILAWTFVCMFPFFLLLDRFGLLRVNDLEEIVGLDANYGIDTTPDRLFDQDSDTSEADRLRAYQQRHDEKKKARDKRRHGSILEAMHASWGACEFGSQSDLSINVPTLTRRTTA